MTKGLGSILRPHGQSGKDAIHQSGAELLRVYPILFELEQELFMVAEPVVTVCEAANDVVTYERFGSRREGISRAITGEELLDRLRPRIKSLFK